MGIGGGIITKKLLFVALLIASLSLGGITAASAADVSATQIQTSNTNTLNKDINTQSNSANISKNSTKTQNSVDKSVKEVNKTNDKKQVTTQNANKVKTTDATTSQSSTNVQKSENVVKQESTVSSSSTVSQNTVNDVSTTNIQNQNTNTINNVSTTDIQNQNTVQNTSNVNDVKVNADNTSAISETTNNTTQSQPSTTDSKTVDTSNQTTTVNVPVTNQNTETNTNVSPADNTTTPTTNQSTVTTTPKTDNTTDQYSAAAGDTVTPTFTIDQVKDAASRVRAYIETTKNLPNYVQISTYQINMNQFLEMLASALLQINNGTNNPITVKSFTAPTSPKDNIVSGNLLKSEYLKIASDIKNYMDSTGKTPDYAYQTSLGTYLGYQNLVYMYSMILDYYNTSGKMADYAIMKPWSVVSGTATPVPAELLPYLASTANCQVDNPQIKALAASITSGKTSTYDKAVAIFNWVRDNLSYSFYYNTQYGAVGALNAGTGNCVDTSHLLIALERAAGIPAKYVNGYAQFSSGNWYGHVWAQVWIDGKWYAADASSNYNTFGVINNWNTATATIYGTYASLPF